MKKLTKPRKPSKKRLKSKKDLFYIISKDNNFEALSESETINRVQNWKVSVQKKWRNYAPFYIESLDDFMKDGYYNYLGEINSVYLYDFSEDVLFIGKIYEEIKRKLGEIKEAKLREEYIEVTFFPDPIEKKREEEKYNKKLLEYREKLEVYRDKLKEYNKQKMEQEVKKLKEELQKLKST